MCIIYPYQPVVRTERDATKLRIVFDASSKTSNEPSLNQLLHSGPCLLPLLYDILLRFRLGKFAITSDIKQTFLQIELDVMRRDFTRFLWFSNCYSENRDNVIYRFTRILFGLRCSPFILTGTLKYHFKNFLQENKPADKISNNNIFDDNTINVNSERELRKSRRVAAMNANLIRRLNEED